MNTNEPIDMPVRPSFIKEVRAWFKSRTAERLTDVDLWQLHRDFETILRAAYAIETIDEPILVELERDDERPSGVRVVFRDQSGQARRLTRAPKKAGE